MLQIPFEPGEHALTIDVGQRKRKYILHVPAARVAVQGGDASTAKGGVGASPGGKGLPIVFVLHGGGGTARLASTATGWSRKADQAGFSVVYPEALRPHPDRPPSFLRNPQFWNVGSGIGHGEHANVDDVAFVRSLVDELTRRLPIDRRCIYATGFSNGGGLTFRLGMELADRFAAIAPVSGNCWRQGPRPSRPVSMIYISGAADPMNPLDGAEIESPWGPVLQPPPIEQTIRRWAGWAGCPLKPRVLHDRDGVRRLRYGPGDRGVEVDFVTIEGAGHAWPGGQPVLAERFTGPPTDKLSATDVIWEFFEQRPQPEGGD